MTERPPTETPAATEPVEPTATSVPLASPETLLTTRGAPDTLYTVANDDLVALTLSADDRQEHVIDLPDDRPLLDVAASPNGDRVAVLVGPSDSDSDADADADDVALLIYDRTGKQIEKARSVLDVAAASATPAAAGVKQRYTVNWSPQGDTLLVASASALVNVPVSGDPEPITLRGVTGSIRSAAWSPQGSRIAVVVAHKDAAQEVVLVTRDGDMTEVPALTVKAGTSIEQLDWLPDGSGLIFVRATLTDGVPLGGQLFTYKLAEEAPTLVATSGQGGPSATITMFAPSSDGRTVAYVIAIRDGDQWSFHSLWVRSFKQPLAYQVPVDPVAAVTRLWWVGRGLAWDQTITEESNSPSAIVYMSTTNEPTVLLQMTPESSEATPAATPAG